MFRICLLPIDDKHVRTVKMLKSFYRPFGEVAGSKDSVLGRATQSAKFSYLPQSLCNSKE